MRRLPQYVGNLKHGAWQQSGLKAASMPPNFGIGMVLASGCGSKTLIRLGGGSVKSLVVLIVMGAILMLCAGLMFKLSQSELAPEEDQGIVLGQIAQGPRVAMPRQIAR